MKIETRRVFLSSTYVMEPLPIFIFIVHIYFHHLNTSFYSYYLRDNTWSVVTIMLH